MSLFLSQEIKKKKSKQDLIDEKHKELMYKNSDEIRKQIIYKEEKKSFNVF